jgi:hypothetical protein
MAGDDALAALRVAMRRFPANQRLPELLETRIACWIVEEVNPYPSSSNKNDEAMDRLEPQAHADMVIRAIESRCDALGVDSSLFPAVAYRVAILAGERAAEQRHADLLYDARRTAARLSAFANTLVRRNPKEPAFRLLLCLASVQESKNAWRVPDRAAIKEALRQATREARTALRLDPHYSNAGVTPGALEEKLVDLLCELPSSR